mmetsp:Transcript_10321/g.20897  ORF Transcript_10321/g.20897 Transcript_10321/m.20897 type:complete len:247 (-) Transcript_10321:258-998(-)
MCGSLFSGWYCSHVSQQVDACPKVYRKKRVVAGCGFYISSFIDCTIRSRSVQTIDVDSMKVKACVPVVAGISTFYLLYFHLMNRSDWEDESYSSPISFLLSSSLTFWFSSSPRLGVSTISSALSHITSPNLSTYSVTMVFTSRPVSSSDMLMRGDPRGFKVSMCVSTTFVPSASLYSTLRLFFHLPFSSFHTRTFGSSSVVEFGGIFSLSFLRSTVRLALSCDCEVGRGLFSSLFLCPAVRLVSFC